MEIEQIIDTINSWESILEVKQKKYIHFRSMSNFVFHFNKLPNNGVKDKVHTILTAYVNDVQDHYFDFSSNESFELTTKYMNKLSDIYSRYLKFRSFITLRFVILFSLIGDGLLYVLFKNSLTFYFPFVGFALIAYYFYIKVFFERKKLVFGIFY